MLPVGTVGTTVFAGPDFAPIDGTGKTSPKPISLLGDMTKRDFELTATSDRNPATQRTLQWKPGDLGARRKGTHAPRCSASKSLH